MIFNTISSMNPNGLNLKSIVALTAGISNYGDNDSVWFGNGCGDFGGFNNLGFGGCSGGNTNIINIDIGRRRGRRGRRCCC